jgi:hypothetical protein
LQETHRHSYIVWLCVHKLGHFSIQLVSQLFLQNTFTNPFSFIKEAVGKKKIGSTVLRYDVVRSFDSRIRCQSLRYGIQQWVICRGIGGRIHKWLLCQEHTGYSAWK